MIDLSDSNPVDAQQLTPHATSSHAGGQVSGETRQAIACQRERRDWESLALSQWFDGPDDDPEYQAQLASLPDIRDTR